MSRVNLKRGVTVTESGASQAGAAAPDVTQFAWLIERYYHSQLHYWTGRAEKETPWTTNAYDAVRFARRTDAEAMLSWHLNGIGNVVQHGFYK